MADPVALRDEILNIMIAGRDTVRFVSTLDVDTAGIHMTAYSDSGNADIRSLHALSASRGPS